MTDHKKSQPARNRRAKPISRSLDAFTLAYLEAALWSSTDDAGEPLDRRYGIKDVAPDTLREAIDDCKNFQIDHGDDLYTCATEHGRDYDYSGHDFWLTRNRHGAGFWDRGYPAELSRRLTDAAHAYGSIDLYVGDDGLIHG